MKAWDVLLFLLTLNAGIWVVQGMGVFGSTTFVGGFPGQATFVGFATAAGGAIAGAGAKFLSSKISSVRGAAAGVFITFYLSMTGTTVSALASIHVPALLISVITALNAAVLVAAVLEMGTAGWGSYK